MSESTAVKLSFEKQIATITISREPQLNALNQDVLQGLANACEQLAPLCRGAKAYESCRVLLIRGAGEKAFVAGADIKLMQSATPAELKTFTLLGQRVMRELEALPLPVIAVVPGFAIGGGMELALACDLIMASVRASFGQAEVKLGLIPGFGGTQRLVDRVGVGSSKRMIFTGDSVTAEEAYRMGLVDYLVPHESLEARVTELCESLLARSPIALAAAKRAIEQHVAPLKLPGLQAEAEEFLSSAGSADAKEGMLAFLEKRKPLFRGKYE